MKRIFKDKDKHIVLSSDTIQAEFLRSGDLYRLGTETRMINQVLSNPIDGALNNLYLRIFKANGEIKFTPLLGVHSPSHFSVGEQQVKWEGHYEEVTYEVLFVLSDQDIWFWHVKLEGNGQEVDIIYGQDIGLADQGALQKNEAYIAQYVDHKVFEEKDQGYAVALRQNQPQTGDEFPYVQQGSLHQTVGYSTDGLQFFGTQYKETNVPVALSAETLANQIYQYEFTYTALQSEKVTLDEPTEFVFYGCYQANHEEAISDLAPVEAIASLWHGLEIETEFELIESIKAQADMGEILTGESIEPDEINEWYPQRKQAESEQGQLLSFFTDKFDHVVLKEKEALMERPHGHILFSGNHLTVNHETMSTTNWMYGVFNAHTVAGNTDQNKWLTNTRNPLDLFKTTGQRIYIKIEGKYRLLGMPSLYEMGINHTKWLYKTEYDTFVVTTIASASKPEVRLELKTLSGHAYETLITNQVVMNPDEYIYPVYYEVADNLVSFYSDDQTLNKAVFPHLRYDLMVAGAAFEVVDERALVSGVDPGAASLTVLKVAKASRIELVMQSHLEGGAFAFTDTTFNEEIEQFRAHFRKVTHNLAITHDEHLPEVLEKLNLTIWWYTHNMFVHYLMPHGLEQYSGAAWGTRDVSQGPAEYFLAMQHYEIVKDILLTIYSHQNMEDGNWPQWFMFDLYKGIQADESHGDVIVWPLKILSDYIAASGDIGILEEKVPYMSQVTHQPAEEMESLFDHIAKQLKFIQANFIEGTYLSKYLDGDWNDSLQPQNENLRQYMVSSWTVALTYQTLVNFSNVLAETYPAEAETVKELVKHIKADYQKYMLVDEVVPGLVYMESLDNVEYMLHPTDQKTGIHYRMLPMIRGIISEIFTKKQAEKHHQLIEEKLHFPDGVHLMERPATYKGGISEHFKRAEQASFLGREVGQNYIHANIRYIEAMAKLGAAAKAWQELEVINPINTKDVVPNAMMRQNNAYFSSSDPEFMNRYEAQENYQLMKDGEVPVKGGWRIYSSGPGIYLNQLISNLLGIRQENQNLVIDPVLPESFDGIKVNFAYHNVPVTYAFHFTEERVDFIVVNGEKVVGEMLANPYRQGALMFEWDEVNKRLTKTDNRITIYYN